MLKSLDDDEQYNQLLDVFTEVKILTGAVMYSGKELEVQIDVLRRFLAGHQDAKSMTISEIRHAFYLNSFGEYKIVLRHYNRELNAEFIGDILSAYQNLKHHFFQKAIDNIKLLINPKTNTAKVIMTSKELELQIQSDYENFKNKKINLIFCTNSKYYFLRKRRLIQLTSKESWIRNYNQAFQTRMSEKFSSISQTKIREALYLKIISTGFLPLKEHKAIIHSTHKIIYLKFFDIIFKTAIVSIFEDIEV